MAFNLGMCEGPSVVCITFVDGLLVGDKFTRNHLPLVPRSSVLQENFWVITRQPSVVSIY